MQPVEDNKSSPWHHRIFPENGSSIIPHGPATKASCQSSPASSRADFSVFINSMDDASVAYLSLLREYASRPLQGRALEYEGLYKAMVSQQAGDEELSRISVIEFETAGLRSKSFPTYNEFNTYLELKSTKDAPRRLIILEDLPVRFVCLLGSRLRIHPCVFARHYSTEDSSTISDNVTNLPSIFQTSTHDGLDYASDDELLHEPDKRRSFTLAYPVTMPWVTARQHPNPRQCSPWLKPSERLKDQGAYPRFVVERCMETRSRRSQWDARGEVSRLDSQATYWYQTLHEGGWNGEQQPLRDRLSDRC